MTHFPTMKSRTASIWTTVSVLAMAASAVVPAPATAQQQNIAMTVASMREDLRLLDERVRQMSVEMEELRRENRALREKADATNAASYVTVQQFNTALAELEKALRTGDKEVALQMTTQLEKLAKQTQSALDTLAKSASIAAPQKTFQFTNDYPQTGTTYTVMSGDTISSIAQKFGSTARDIQNANKIADPRTLQAGQVIFVPQKKE